MVSTFCSEVSLRPSISLVFVEELSQEFDFVAGGTRVLKRLKGVGGVKGRGCMGREDVR
jgi:hypothetical protein